MRRLLLAWVGLSIVGSLLASGLPRANLVQMPFTPAGPPPTHIQNCFGTINFGSSVTTSQTGDGGAGSACSTIGAGHLVVGYVTVTAEDQTVSSVSDGTNTYTLVSGATSHITGRFYFCNITGTPSVITATLSGSSASAVYIVADEYSNVLTSSCLDQSAIHAPDTSPGAGTDAISSGNVTTTTSGELIYGGLYQQNSLTTMTPGTGFTQRLLHAIAHGTVMSEDKVQSAAGVTAATFTDATNGGSNNYDVFGLTFKP